MTGSDLSLTIRSAATDAVGSWRTLLELGQPRDWAWTAVPFLVGAFGTGNGPTPGVVLGLLYLLLPFWLARHGANDLVQGRAGLAPATTWFAIAVVTLPLLVLIGAVAGTMAGLALAALTSLAFIDALPPVRARDRPWADLAIIGLAAFLLALSGPLAAGAALGEVPWPLLIAFAAWSVGLAAIGRIAALPDDRAGTTGLIGARPTALVALVAVALAVLSTFLVGGFGTLAAVGVALYLLLPAMPVLRSGREWVTVAAAREAIGERPALDVLVGAWLALLLARIWGLITWDGWGVVLVVSTVLVGYALLTMLLTRIVTRRHRFASLPIGWLPPPLVIIVPCHDDADRLPACLAAIRAQTYADTSVLVVDTGSLDGSQDEAVAWFDDDVVIAAPPTPAGREPRDWARDVGVENTDEDLILFVAPDTILAPIATRVMVERLESGRLDLLSGVPRDLMPTVGERAGVPGFAMALFGLVPLWFPALTHGRPSATAFADGGLTLVRRSTYLAAIAGIRADAHGEGLTAPADASPAHVEHRVADGRPLAQAVVRSGHRIGLIHAARLAGRRRTWSLAGTVAIWRRRTAHGGRAHLAPALAGMVVLALAFGAPLVFPFVALVADTPPFGVSVAAIPLGGLILVRIVLAITQRQPLLSIVWHPVTVVVALIGQAAGIVDRVRGEDVPPSGADDDANETPAIDDPFGDLPDPTLPRSAT